MLCGYLHPYFSNLLTTIDGLAPARKAVVRSAVLACSAVVGYFYFVHVYCLPKIEYNKVRIMIAQFASTARDCCWAEKQCSHDQCIGSPARQCADAVDCGGRSHRCTPTPAGSPSPCGSLCAT
jgi:hypothetical protein